MEKRTVQHKSGMGWVGRFLSEGLLPRSLNVKYAGVEHPWQGKQQCVISDSNSAGLITGGWCSPMAIYPFLCWVTALLLQEEVENTDKYHCENVTKHNVIAHVAAWPGCRD